MISFPHIIVVDASAGSGKTWRLAQRFIHLLFNNNPQNILAITFTNDAANEMKYRILKWLKECALGKEETINQIKSSYESSFLSNISREEIIKKSESKVYEILKNYLDFNVRTIDSFVNSIASSSSLEIGLPPGYEITMDSFPYIEYVVDLLLSSLEDEKNKDNFLFDKFLVSYLSIEEQKSWSPKENILEKVNELKTKENIYGLKFKKFPEVELWKMKEDILKILEEEKDKYSGRMKNAVEKTIATQDFEKLINWIGKLSSTLQKKLDKYYYSISSMRFNSYIDILKEVEFELDKIKKRKRIMFIDELNIEINKYLEKSGVVPEIYFMLGDTIFHYLIDEFQDTNEIQWKNLYPLIENSLSQGGSLFYVGDKKQALYRFRGGSVRLFDRVKNDFPSVEDIKEEPLRKNFRSRENIVNFNNKIFSKNNLEKIEEINEEIKNTYENSYQVVCRDKNPEGGYVKIRKIEEALLEDVEEKIKEEMSIELEDITSRYDYRDIVILSRENDDVQKITKWLIEKGYPVASEVTLDLRENSYINEIVGFLHFLNSPLDDLFFVSFILGEIFLTKSGLDKKELFSFLEESKNYAGPLYLKFRNKYGEVWQKYIQPFFNKVGFLPPYDLIFEIFKVYNILEKFSNNEGFFMRILEIIKEREEIGENSLQEFLEYWDNQEKKEDFQIVLPKYVNALKVSTIHKAKGLNFPVVIDVFIPGKNNSNMFVDKKEDIELKYINNTYSAFSVSLKELQDREKCETLIDELNTLYVGMTRAEDEMYIFQSSYRKCKNEFFSLFEEGEFGKKVKIYPKVSKEPVLYKEEILEEKKLTVKESLNLKQSQLVSPHWSEKISRNKIDINTFVDLERRRMIERGDFIHYVFSKIDRIEGEVNEFIEEKINSSARELIFNGDIDEIKTMIFRVFSLKEVKEWFSFSGFNEKEIVNRKGELLRIDRFIISPQQIYVIEYKTGEIYKEEHLNQINKYIDAVKEIYPSRKIEGYILYVEELEIIRGKE